MRHPGGFLAGAVAILAVVAAPGPAAALTDTFRTCLAKAGSEPATADCARAERDRQDRRLKAVWAAVRKAAARRDGKHADLTESAHRRWLAFRGQHCRFVAGRAAGGHSQTYWGARCEARLNEQRAAELAARLKAYRR